MNFNEWYDKTYPDSIGKFDGLHVACKSAASFAWDAAHKEIIEMIDKNTICDGCYCVFVEEIEHNYGLEQGE